MGGTEQQPPPKAAADAKLGNATNVQEAPPPVEAGETPSADPANPSDDVVKAKKAEAAWGQDDTQGIADNGTELPKPAPNEAAKAAEQAAQQQKAAVDATAENAADAAAAGPDEASEKAAQDAEDEAAAEKDKTAQAADEQAASKKKALANQTRA